MNPRIRTHKEPAGEVSKNPSGFFSSPRVRTPESSSAVTLQCGATPWFAKPLNACDTKAACAAKTQWTQAVYATKGAAFAAQHLGRSAPRCAAVLRVFAPGEDVAEQDADRIQSLDRFRAARLLGDDYPAIEPQRRATHRAPRWAQFDQSRMQALCNGRAGRTGVKASKRMNVGQASRLGEHFKKQHDHFHTRAGVASALRFRSPNRCGIGAPLAGSELPNTQEFRLRK